MDKTDNSDTPTTKKKKFVVEEVGEEATKTDEVKTPKEVSAVSEPQSPEATSEVNEEKAADTAAEEAKPEVTIPTDVPPQPPQPTETIQEAKSSKFKILYFIIPGFLLLSALGGGIYFYQRQVKVKGEATETVPAQEAASTPEPTPTPEPIDRSKYLITVLNGSGVKGEGDKAENFLTEAGFKVFSVSNAGRFDYKETEIQAKADIDKEFIEELTNVLSKTYVVGPVEELPEDEKVDIVVTIGSETSEIPD